MKLITLTAAATLFAVCGYSQTYLPLTSGPGNALTGDLHIHSDNPQLFLINGTSSTGKNWKLNSYTNGNFYIGVAGAFDALTFNGATGNATFNSSITASNSAGSNMIFSNGVTNYGFLGSRSFIGGQVTDYTNYSNTNLFNEAPNGNYYITTGIARETRLSVTNNGKVGIGTNAPSTNLHVAIQPTTNIVTKQSDLNGYLHLSDYYTSQLGTKTGIVASFQSSPGIASGVVFGRYGSVWGTYIGFHTHGDNANSLDELTEKMRIDGNGNVGIGTATPDSKLTVAGKIHSQEVKVTVNAGADFVFHKDYHLKPLEEVANYISQNKHLPEIASADEMKKNGVELGEMNIKLLQKIEELTLHLINQNSLIREQSRLDVEQNKRIEELEKQLKK